MAEQTEKKITKRERFEQIKALLTDHPELVAFCDHELELLAKKNSADKKPTAKQNENAALCYAIYTAMEPNRLYRISEMMKEFACCDDLSAQKVGALVQSLIKDGKVERREDKRKAYFVAVKQGD